jgi:ABC-type multidrug transport system fused ATPase/permease subunit
VALVQAYDRHSAVTEWFHRESFGRFVAEMAATRLRAVFRPLTEMLEVIGVVLVMGMGVWALRHDQITLGGLMVFLTYLTRLYSPIRGAGRLSNTVYAASASAERIIDLLNHQPDIHEPAQPRNLNQARGRLVFDGVSFSYPGTSRTALKGITFAIAPGQTVALVGASGGGKSTLGKLLLRSTILTPAVSRWTATTCGICH